MKRTVRNSSLILALVIGISIVLAFGLPTLLDQSVILGPHAPIEHIEFSQASFDNATNVLTVNATLKILDINTVNPKYRRMYFEVPGPYLFTQAKIYLQEQLPRMVNSTLIAIVNFTMSELVADKTATINVSIDKPLFPGNYSVTFQTPDSKSSYNANFIVP